MLDYILSTFGKEKIMEIIKEQAPYTDQESFPIPVIELLIERW